MKEINIRQYVDFETIGKTPEFHNRALAVESLLEELLLEGELLTMRSYILEADEVGISLYEKMLGLASSGTLEQRRQRVFIEWNRDVIYTYRGLSKALDVMLGKDNYTLNVSYEDRTLGFRVNTTNTEVDRDYMMRWMRKIIPANMGFAYTDQMGQTIFWASAFRKRKHLIFLPYSKAPVFDEPIVFAGYLGRWSKIVKPGVEDYIYPMAITVNGRRQRVEFKSHKGHVRAQRRDG